MSFASLRKHSRCRREQDEYESLNEHDHHSFVLACRHSFFPVNPLAASHFHPKTDLTPTMAYHFRMLVPDSFCIQHIN